MSGEQKSGAEDPGKASTEDQRPRDPKLSLLTRLVYLLEIFWLFTKSDFLTFVVPNTVFGILGALSGSRLTTDAHVSVGGVLRRIPLVIFSEIQSARTSSRCASSLLCIGSTNKNEKNRCIASLQIASMQHVIKSLKQRDVNSFQAECDDEKIEFERIDQM